jgi:hypothetical protein
MRRPKSAAPRASPCRWSPKLLALRPWSRPKLVTFSAFTPLVELNGWMVTAGLATGRPPSKVNDSRTGGGCRSDTSQRTIFHGHHSVLITWFSECWCSSLQLAVPGHSACCTRVPVLCPVCPVTLPCTRPDATAGRSDGSRILHPGLRAWRCTGTQSVHRSRFCGRAPAPGASGRWGATPTHAFQQPRRRADNASGQCAARAQRCGDVCCR